MKDPYSVLGVSPNASDDEVKTAYRNLARKYHPDNYEDDNPLKDLANEKMQEINLAYDEIQKMRAAGPGNNTYNSNNYNYGNYNSNTYGANNNYNTYNTNNNGYNNTNNANNANNNGYNNTNTNNNGYNNTNGGIPPIYAQIRAHINNRRFSDAERDLLSVDIADRIAEWHYLMSLVLMSRNNVSDAMRELEIACNMDPGNYEYQKAKQMFNTNTQSYGNNYYGSANSRPMRNNDACDCCANLICMDCLCECMGGDLIPCC